MGWIARNLSAGAIQAIGGVITLTAGAALMSAFLSLPTAFAILIVLLVMGIALFVLGTAYRMRESRSGAAPSQTPTKAISITTGPPIYPSTTSPQAEADREFVNEAVTPRFLVDQIQGLMSAQVKARIQPYVGAWIRVAGKVIDVSETLGVRAHIRIPDSPNPPNAITAPYISVYAHFDDTWRERVLRLPQNADVELVGRIADILGGPLFRSLVVEHAEIVARPIDP